MTDIPERLLRHKKKGAMVVKRRTLKALKASIKKWEKNASVTTMTELAQTRICMQDCPLCAIFCIERGNINNCLGCPIMMRSGKSGCRDTPYTSCFDERLKSNIQGFRDAAQCEVEFLQSLLPHTDSKGYQR